MLLLMSLRRYNSVFEVSNCLLIVSRSEECCEMSRSKRVFEVLFSESSQAILFSFVRHLICGVFLTLRPGGFIDL